MSKINGIELKAVKTFVGHDGPGYLQGNVYYKGKKLGFWSQDAWCGPDYFDFDTDILSQAVADFQTGFSDDYKYKEYLTSPEMVFDEILKMNQKEKFVKKKLKEGFSVVLVSDFRQMISLPVAGNLSDEEIMLKYHSKIMEMMDECKGHHLQLEIIHDLKYFNVVVDYKNPAPKYMYLDN